MKIAGNEWVKRAVSQENYVVVGGHAGYFRSGFQARAVGQGLAEINLGGPDDEVATQVAAELAGWPGGGFKVDALVEQAGYAVSGVVGIGGEKSGRGGVGEGAAQVQVGAAAGPADILSRAGRVAVNGGARVAKQLRLVGHTVGNLTGQPSYRQA